MNQQSNILTITLTTKAWASKKFCTYGEKSSITLPTHGENGTQKEKQGPPKEKKPLYEKKATLEEGEKGATNRFFSKRIRGGGGQATTLVTPLCAPMSKCDNEKHNIFDNYSPLIYINIHSRIHPIELFCKKNSWKCIPSNKQL